MYEQRGHFGGLDTCNHVEFGRFDIRSMLRFEVEDRAIANRHDVNIHLDELCKAEIISSEMVKNMRHSANRSKIVKNYEKLCSGASYILIEVAVSFQ